MRIDIHRMVVSNDATIGVLNIDGKVECWTLEDKGQSTKVPGQTRIPAGQYALFERKFGGFYKRYSSLFSTWSPKHRGMIEIMDVPGFSNILFHIGNSTRDTRGCILVGEKALLKKGLIEISTFAYKQFYHKVIGSVANKECTLVIHDNVEQLSFWEE